MAENLNFNSTGSRCHSNKQAFCDKYGRLYQWNAAVKACPNGWKLASAQEWDKLVNTYGGTKSAYSNLIKDGFGVLLGGYCFDNGKCFGMSIHENYHCSTEVNATETKFYYFKSYEGKVCMHKSSGRNGKAQYLSCRCIKK